MKDNLLDALKNLLLDSIESTLSVSAEKGKLDEDGSIQSNDPTLEHVADPKAGSFRIFDDEEYVKLNLFCHNFLLRVEQLGLLLPRIRERIINQLMQSEATTVSFDDVKWTFIDSLNTNLTENELLFLDFVLDEKEDIVH
jgi:uncharacterized protein Smg (DUF494 family)